MADEIELADEISTENDIEIKLIKLDNNDLIIAQLCNESYEEHFLVMIDPIHVEMHVIQHHGKLIKTYSLGSWIPLSDDNILSVPYNKILNISLPSEEVIDKYFEFLYDEPEDEFNESPVDSVENTEDETDEEFDSMVESFTSKPDKPTFH